MRTIEEINQMINQHKSTLKHSYNKFAECENERSNSQTEIRINQQILYWLNWTLGEEHFNSWVKKNSWEY